MRSVHFLLAFVLLTLASSIASAYDPSPLQDFCVAINDPKAAGNAFFLLHLSFTFHKKLQPLTACY
jgi:hypothetical protein